MSSTVAPVKSASAAIAGSMSGRARLGIVALYAVTLAVSAGLVFMVQPMFTRFVLPLLGGTPAVWTTAMLFFQTVLLLAYLYAHWSVRRFGARRQAALHLALVAAGLLVLPIGVPESWTPPSAGTPVPWLLLLLVLSVGLPFFVVASTAPLLQSWLASTSHPDGRDPYFLYRASNLGSVLGLLAYPVLVEPRFTLDGQSWLWSAGYGTFLVLLVGCAVVLWRAPRAAGLGGVLSAVKEAVAAPISRSQRLRWVALAFVPSSLMLGVTVFLTVNVAPIPLLWALPLSLYLLSFIVVFSRSARAERMTRAAVVAFPVLIVLTVVVSLSVGKPIWLVGGVHLTAFFATAMICHGQLAAERPPASQLTQFYAWLSVGGALGGVFGVVIAPLVFNGLTEYPIAIVAACFCLPLVTGRWSDPVSFVRVLLPPLLFGAGLVALLFATEGNGSIENSLVYALAGIVCVQLAGHPVRFGLAVMALLVGAWVPTIDDKRVIHQDRSFFGVNAVESTNENQVHLLRNGTILHGAQISTDGLPVPQTYYHPSGPVGQLLEGLPDRSVASRAGIVGLGTGTMACHARSGDRWTFFEIDPTVERLARNNKLFTYLRDCPGKHDVVLGDARLSIKREPDGRFGLLALDAFSSDAVPIHLLTTEAVELYKRKLLPNGVIAFHISNGYLKLEEVVGNVAAKAGLTCFAQLDRTTDDQSPLKDVSHWAVMARSPADLGKAATDRRWHPCGQDSGQRAWSDDYSNVLGAFKW